ncbi:MAG TPA: hypothetical protein VFH72_05140 [Candidatus Baltobacteraceae bacterium]|nr:hypothetical protein [Candidatus Baltobacteraceae bacterium]
MNTAALLAAGLLGASLAASTMPVHAQSASARARLILRARTMSRPAINPQFIQGRMTPFTMPPAQMHVLPEGGTLRAIVGTDVVTVINRGTLMLRTRTGLTAGLRMPATAIRAMRLTTGTLVRLRALARNRFELRVTGGPLAPRSQTVRQRPVQ